MKRRIDPRLLWIQFPGMQVNHTRNAICLKHAQRAPLIKKRKYPRVSAASYRQTRSQGPDCRWRKLNQLCAGHADHKRLLWSWHAIKVMPHREDTAVVSESSLKQNFQRPKRTLGDGKTRRPIESYSLAAGLLYGIERSRRILLKGARAKLID